MLLGRRIEGDLAVVVAVTVLDKERTGCDEVYLERLFARPLVEFRAAAPLAFQHDEAVGIGASRLHLLENGTRILQRLKGYRLLALVLGQKVMDLDAFLLPLGPSALRDVRERTCEGRAHSETRRRPELMELNQKVAIRRAACARALKHFGYAAEDAAFWRLTDETMQGRRIGLTDRGIHVHFEALRVFFLSKRPLRTSLAAARLSPAEGAHAHYIHHKCVLL